MKMKIIKKNIRTEAIRTIRKADKAFLKELNENIEKNKRINQIDED